MSIHTLAARVEQARARGQSLEQVCADLNVTARFVRNVWAAQDAAAGTSDNAYEPRERVA